MSLRDPEDSIFLIATSNSSSVKALPQFHITSSYGKLLKRRGYMLQKPIFWGNGDFSVACTYHYSWLIVYCRRYCPEATINPVMITPVSRRYFYTISLSLKGWMKLIFIVIGTGFRVDLACEKYICLLNLHHYFNNLVCLSFHLFVCVSVTKIQLCQIKKCY